RLDIHHGSADVIRRRAEAFFQLRPIDRLTYLQHPDLPGVGEELLFVPGVANLSRPHLENATRERVALTFAELRPQRLEIGPQERRLPVDGRLIALVHRLLPPAEAFDLRLHERTTFLDAFLGLPDLADGPLG